MIKRLICLLFALLLAALAVFPAYAHLPGKRPRSTTEESDFIRRVENSRGELLEKEDDSYHMTVENNGYYTVTIPAYAEKTLIFAIADNQGVNMLHLSFREAGSDFRNAGTVSLPLQASAQTCYYLVELPDDMSVTEIRIRPGGTSGGHVSLVAVEPPIVAESYRADYPGEISSATVFGDDTLSVRGSLEEQASLAYLSYQLVLFALDPTETLEDLSEDSLRLATLSVRQKFDFRLRISEEAKAMKYVVALVGNGEIIPLGQPVYATYDSSEVDAPGYKGLYIEGGTELLVAGAQTTIVEFDMSRLLCEKGDADARLYIVDGEFYYLNASYMKGIADALDLADACGISTLLYLTGTEILGGGRTELAVLKTVVSFLAQTYRGTDTVNGIVLNSGRTNMQTDAASLLSYSTALHTLYALVSDSLDGVTVYAEVTETSAPDLATCQLAAAMQQEGEIPYGVIWRTDEMTLDYADTVARLADSGGEAMPEIQGLLWIIHSEAQLLNYSVYTSRMRSSLDIFAVRSIGEAALTRAVTDCLYAFDADERVSTAIAMSEPPAVRKGYYVLEEFDRNVSAALWHMSSDVLSFGTSYSAMFGKKVLSAHLQDTSDHMLAVYVPDLPLNLSEAPYVHLSFAASADTAPSIFGRLIFVSGDRQMVHTVANIPTGSRIDITLSLEKFVGLRQIDAIALYVEGDSLREVYINNITLYSRTLTDKELFDSVHPTPTDATSGKLPSFYLLLGLLGLLTAAVPLLLHLRGREQEARRSESERQ